MATWCQLAGDAGRVVQPHERGHGGAVPPPPNGGRWRREATCRERFMLCRWPFHLAAQAPKTTEDFGSRVDWKSAEEYMLDYSMTNGGWTSKWVTAGDIISPELRSDHKPMTARLTFDNIVREPRLRRARLAWEKAEDWRRDMKKH